MPFIEQLRAAVKELGEAQARRPRTKEPVSQPWHKTIKGLEGYKGAIGKQWISAREVYAALCVPEPAPARSMT